MLIDGIKLKAAQHSMHQYMSSVRPIFPGEVADDVVEVATFFLYIRIARDVFGSRFASRLTRRLRHQLKYNDPATGMSRLKRIAKRAEQMRKALRQSSASRAPEAEFENNVRSAISSLLAEGEFPASDPEVLKLAFKEFDGAVRQIKQHLAGIKKQNHFIMRR